MARGDEAVLSEQATADARARPRRRRTAWGAAIAVVVLAVSAAVAVPAIASSEAPERSGRDANEAVEPVAPTTSAEQIVVCESAEVDHGDGIRTSSASAERVPAGAPVPDGCKAG